MIYAISDLHAHTKLYFKFKKTLKENDMVYVLGDVIDKGDGTIDILIDMLEDKRFILLLGNHEQMMLDYLCHQSYYDRYQDWCLYNDGERTLYSFRKLPELHQLYIKYRLSKLPIQLDIEVGENNFLLSHAYCSRIGNELNWNIDEILMNQRVYTRYIPSFVTDRIVINGHTPVQYINYFYGTKSYDKIFREEINGNIWYDIDCGLAKNDGKGKLGVLNLEDLSEYYIYEED